MNNRNINSLLNAISAIGLTLVNGFLGLVTTRCILLHFGSDFNGLNSTANQIINVLLILEGGFTLASNVALFAPLSMRDYAKANRILSSTRKKFRKIGVVFLHVGIIVAILYALNVNSKLPKDLVFTIILMALLPQAVNLFFATTYRVLLQTQQKEYIINFFTMLTIGVGHITNIILIISGARMWIVRFVTMLFALLNSVLIVHYVKNKNTFINLNVSTDTEIIEGTNDVLIQKITGVIYNAAPIVFLSLSQTGGTVLASVYAVYNSVFIMVKSILHGVIDAPRLSFGQMLTERTRVEIWNVFKQYEYICVCAIFVFITTTCALILPFIDIYTVGVDDINYFDPLIAVLMVIITFVEMLHIPSGHLINMSGAFKTSKNIQIVACVVLIISMLIGGNLWGIYGMLAAILITATSLAIMEISYVHSKFFDNRLKEFIIMVIPFTLAGIVVCYLEIKLGNIITGYISFIFYGAFYFITNTIIVILLSWLWCKKLLAAVVDRIRPIYMLILKKRSRI